MDATVGSTAPAMPPASAAPNCCAGLASLSRRPAGQAAPAAPATCDTGAGQGPARWCRSRPAAGQHRARSHAGDHAGDVAANIRPQPFAARLGVGSPSASPTFGSNSDDDGAMGISVPAMALMPRAIVLPGNISAS